MAPRGGCFHPGLRAVETIKQPGSGSAAVVDEVHPDYLTLDVGGIVLDVTPLQDCLWSLGSVPVEWKTGMLIPILNIGGFLKEGVQLLSLFGKVHMFWTGESSRYSNPRFRSNWNPVIQVNCGPALHPFQGSGRNVGVCMCFVVLENDYDPVPRGILLRALWQYEDPDYGLFDTFCICIKASTNRPHLKTP